MTDVRPAASPGWSSSSRSSTLRPTSSPRSTAWRPSRRCRTRRRRSTLASTCSMWIGEFAEKRRDRGAHGRRRRRGPHRRDRGSSHHQGRDRRRHPAPPVRRARHHRRRARDDDDPVLRPARDPGAAALAPRGDPRLPSRSCCASTDRSPSSPAPPCATPSSVAARSRRATRSWCRGPRRTATRRSSRTPTDVRSRTRQQPPRRLRCRSPPLRRLAPGPDEPAHRARGDRRRLETSGSDEATDPLPLGYNRSPVSVPIAFTPRPGVTASRLERP